jgi:hypothetical protein
MSVRRDRTVRVVLPPEAEPVARLALAEARLRGLAAAEEYRVIADRLYRAGVRDLPSGLLLDWIEATVATDYEELLRLRSLGEHLCGSIAAGDIAGAAWRLASELDVASRQRLIDGLERMNDLDDTQTGDNDRT